MEELINYYKHFIKSNLGIRTDTSDSSHAIYIFLWWNLSVITWPVVKPNPFKQTSLLWYNTKEVKIDKCFSIVAILTWEFFKN